MTKIPPTIFVVDDDARVLTALGYLLHAAQYTVQVYDSPQLFLKQFDVTRPGCVIVDLAMPKLNGVALQRKLKARGSRTPLIFLTGHKSIPWTVQALQEGAVDFLTKPVDENRLLQSVRTAVKRDAEMRAVQARLSCLTERECELLGEIASGKLYKEIADEFGVSLRTVKFHRANLTRKLRITATAELIRLGIQGGLATMGERIRPPSDSR